jgi:alkylation response protein AidB-like acyl-CoA dehydrogenase
MNFDATEEQRLLAASIARFVERDYAFERRRTIVASPEGMSRDVWRAMADLGLTALLLPADCGGFGGGAVDAMAVMEAIGEALLVEPWLATVGVAAQLVARGGNEAQRQRLLPGVADGTRLLAFAHVEAEARHDPAFVATRAATAADDSGFVLTGVKRAVPAADAVDTLIVSARTSGDAASADGIGLFVVERSAPGVSTRALRMLDGTRAADVALDGVHVNADAALGTPGSALPLIEDVLDVATALVCAEAVGAIRSANDATLEYLKTRKQFGVPIGAFQALQHRMVDLAIELEQATSMASLACAAVDGERDRRRRARVVSGAKVRIADACRRVSQESIQLHGGIGMSDELKVSHTFRRLTAIAQQFGDADHHLARFAALGL